jgi:polysaccharide export outer membrane protein
MNHLPRFSILCLMLASLAVSSPGQKESLLIGPGDLLHLFVYDTPEMEQHARVTDTGNIPFNFLGNVNVAGLTPEQAAEQIEQRLQAAGIMLHPQVSVNVEAYATENASVMGEVQKPGTYEIDTPHRVVDVLAMAGGLTAIADRHITIQRFGPGKQKVDYYYSNAGETALSNDPMVYPGDSVVVSKVAVVYVLGDVFRPGGYPINTNNSKMTALQAIALAGYANHTAAVGKSRLVRATPQGVQEINLPVGAMQKGKMPDVALLPDDVVYVPFSFVRNLEVNSQGILASVTSAALYIH